VSSEYWKASYLSWKYSAMSLFGKKVTPEEYVKKWKRELKHEERNLERTIRSIEMEEAKVKKSIKDLAKKGELGSVKQLAQELLKSRKTKERLYQSKAQINSVSMQLTSSLSMMKLAGVMQKSTQVMGMMNSLIRLPELNKVMMTMSREMEKAGLIEEILQEPFEDEELDEEADHEVDRIVEEITMPLKTAKVAHDALPAKQAAQKEQEVDELEERLGALKN